MNLRLSAVLVAAAIGIAAPASAWEGRVVRCYDSVYVPATYTTKKTLHMAAHTKWEHRHGQLVEVYYPAVYIEKRALAHAEHYVKHVATCKTR